jgi:hypothetical protein
MMKQSTMVVLCGRIDPGRDGMAGIRSRGEKRSTFTQIEETSYRKILRPDDAQARSP